MHIENYKKYTKDKNVIKGGGYVNQFFLIPKSDTIFLFDFSYLDVFSNHFIEPPKRRIGITLFSKKNLISEMPFKIIDRKVIIVANAENEDYAISYELSVEKNKKTISAILLEEPNIAQELITQQEKTGIAVKY